MPNVILIPGGSSTASPFSWQTVPIGAGGYLQGASIAFDGTTQYLMTRTDTYGAYRWDPAGTSPIGTVGTWTQLITSQSMPTDYINGSYGQAGQGVYEIQMCYSTPSVVYMMAADVNSTSTNNFTVFKSANYGNSWVRTGFTPVGIASANPNDGTYKMQGPKICINPSDSTKLYVGTQGGAGLWLSTNGGTLFSLVSTASIPNPSAGGYSGMCWSRSNTSNIYISSNGHGVYFSNSGGSNWAALTSGVGPSIVRWADIDENTGSYWCVEDSTKKLWKWNGSIWSNPITGGGDGQAVAIDPATANHVIFFDHDTMYETTNGTSFGVASNAPSYTGADVSWIQNSQVFGYGQKGACYYDRTAARKTYSFYTFGTYTATWSGAVAGTTPTFSTQSRGIEQMVGLEAVIPPGGSPVCTVWDNGVFYKAKPLNTSYPSNLYFPGPAAASACWSCDYAGQTPTFLVAIGDGSYEGYFSYCSTNSIGGSGAWTSIQSTMPISQIGGACIGVSTTTNFIFSDCNTRQPYYTTDGGSTWHPITLPGSPNFISPGFGGNQGTGKWIIADKVNSGNFAFVYPALGFFTTTNGGSVFSGPFNASVASNVGGSNAEMKPVFGQAGHAFICNPVIGGTGGIGGATLFGNYFGYTTNMYAGVSQAWTQITNVGIANNFGFGAPAPGNSYPTIFYTGYSLFACSNTVTVGAGVLTFSLTGSPTHTILAGSAVSMSVSSSVTIRGSVVSYVGGVLTVNIDTVISGSGPHSGWFAQILGAWQTSGNGPSATPTWTQIAPFPNNSIDGIQDISGHPDVYGACFVSFGGASFVVYAAPGTV